MVTEGIKLTGVNPDFLKGPIFENDVYAIYIGLGKDKDVMPHYLVVHKENEVVEFENDIYYLVLSWVQHFTTQLKEFKNDELEPPEAELADDEEVITGDNVTQFRPKH